MKEDIKLGIFSWFGFVLPLPERLLLIKKAGFDAVSLWWEDEQAIGQGISLRKGDFTKLVIDSGLIVENIHAPFNNSNDLWSDHKLIRKRVVERHLNWLEDCAIHNIPLMVMHLTEGDSTPEPNKYGIETMSCLVRFAEDVGVKIAIENTRREDNIDYLLSEIQSEHLGYCYDSSHANLYHDKGEYLLKNFGNRLIATHLSDNDGIKDRHWLPGNGIISWERLLKKYAFNTYKRYLTLEVCADYDEMKEGPEPFLGKAFHRLSFIRELKTLHHKI
ncbi:MAG: sugar phosphate isomerase/epimerase [Firmicutes bacterium HGW-Firmicutes-12]|jgi:sugar phosphate isomerase/epimerase|nr:MAG: sugar phosphate isomerase/epimerase [Firmicutes bacterium HGW-Firmicutes-12]